MEADPKNKVPTPQELKNRWKWFKIMRNAAMISGLMIAVFASGVPHLNIDRDGITFAGYRGRSSDLRNQKLD